MDNQSDSDALTAAVNRVEGKLDRLLDRLDKLREGAILEPTRSEIKVFGDQKKLKALAASLDLRFKSFNHSWWCNIVNNCKSSYWNVTFVINTSNGSVQSWNAIETAVQLSTDSVPIDWNHKGEWYRYQAGGTHAECGWHGEKDGRDVEIWGLARFYFPTGGGLAWRWFSRA